MELRDLPTFIAYYQSVRARTRRLLALVPPHRLEWRYQPDKFTIGDQIRHIAAIERQLYAEALLGHPPRYAGCGPELAAGYEATLAYFDRCHAETLAILGSLPPERLHKRLYPLGEPGITAWKWLRLLPEHEIHHRGQLYVYLGLLGIDAPPIFGLRSEELPALPPPGGPR